MKWGLFLLGLLVWPVGVGAQIDSIRQCLQKATTDTERLTIWYSLALYQTRIQDFSGSEASIAEGLVLARKLGDRCTEGALHHQRGRNASRQNQATEAKKHLLRALRLGHKCPDALARANLYNDLGAAYFVVAQMDSARQYFERASHAYQQLGEATSQLPVLNNLAALEIHAGRLPEALQHYQQILHVAGRTSSAFKLGSVYHNIGTVYSELNDYRLAQDYYRKAIQWLQDCRCDNRMLGSSYLDLSRCCLELDDTTSGIRVARQAFELARHIPDSALHSLASAQLSSIYYKTNHLDSMWWYASEARAYLDAVRHTPYDLGTVLLALSNAEFKLKHYPEARSLAQDALEQLIQAEDLNGQLVSYQLLHQIELASGNYRQAHDHYVKSIALRDSLMGDRNQREIGRLEAQYEARKAQEVLEARRQAERQQHRWMLGSAAGALLFLTLVAFILFRSRRKEQRANATLRALNQEIQMQKAEIEAQNSEITAQRDQLNATNLRLIELDRMKEQLTGMLVHDLKNPLNAILGLAALPPDADRLRTIRSAGQQMSQLVLNLLDIQKYEEAALVLKPETHPAADLIRQAVEQTAFLAEQKHISFHIEADPGLGVDADGELIVRVLVNLLTNAIKYAPAGDQIAIEASFEASQGAIFRVTDHGRGIPPDELGRVFDRFAQVGGGQASGQLRSTGLGLTFCRLTVEAHGGRIGVQSEVGQFTAFAFNLPQARRVDGRTSEAPMPSLPDVQVELSAAYRAAHAEAFARLTTLPLYSVSDILDAVEALPETEAGVSAWKAALEAAALSGNEAAYRKLLAHR